MIGYLRNRPHLLEKAYQFAEKTAFQLDPLIKKVGYERVERWIKPPEDFVKEQVFGCRRCGQCVLHSTGMTCPMNCPKNLRNGPCGGVRPNGHCEVKPEMRCVWVVAYETSREMPIYGHELHDIQPPVNRLLHDTSAWINMLTGEDKQLPQGWIPLEQVKTELEQARLEQAQPAQARPGQVH